MRRIIAFVLAFITVIAVFGCGKNEEPKNTDSVTTENTVIEDNSVKFSDYQIIYSARASKDVESAVTEFRKNIKEYAGISMEFDYDALAEESDSWKEILIGKTNRAETEEASEILKNAGADSYVIKNYGKKIVILGTSDNDLMFGLNAFLNNFVKTSS